MQKKAKKFNKKLALIFVSHIILLIRKYEEKEEI